MNSVVLMGRLTRDPEYRQTGETTVARYTLAVERRKRDEADFPNIVAFGKAADFAHGYLRKGMRVCISGRIQTGSYEKDGVKVYTTNVVADSQEFCEPRRDDGMTPVDDGVDLDKLFA